MNGNAGPNDQLLLSFFQIASDEVLQEYRARGINNASDVIVPREQRDANPLSCDDSEAGWFIGNGSGGTKGDMPFIIG